MKSTKKIDENGYGYNTTMLPDYDGFIIIKPGFLKYTDSIIKDLHRLDFTVIEALEKTLTKEEAEAERVRVLRETEQKASDIQEVNPYMMEIRYFQVQLAARRSMRVQQVEDEMKRQELLLKERMMREAQRSKKRGLWG